METCPSKGQARSPAGLGRAVAGGCCGPPAEVWILLEAPTGSWRPALGAAPPQPLLMEDGVGPPRVAGHATASSPGRDQSPAPSSVRQPRQERPGGPLCLPRTRVYRPSDGSLEGGHKIGWASPAFPLGSRMRAQPPPGWTRGLPPRGKSTARLERKKKENQRCSRPRGLAEGPALSLPLFLCLRQPRGRPWSSAQPRPL